MSYALRVAGASEAVALLVAAGAGTGLTFAGTRLGPHGPELMVIIAAAPLLVAAVIRHPRLAAVGVFATFGFARLVVVGPLQATEVAVLAAVTLVALRRLHDGFGPLPWVDGLWWPAALLAWTLVSLQAARDETLALKNVVGLAAGIVFACVLIATCTRMAHARTILGGLVVAGVVIAAAALLSGGPQLQAEFGGAQATGRLHGAFEQPNQFGSFCALATLVATGMALGAYSRRARIAFGAGGLVLAGGLLLSLSRGAWIGALLGAVTLVVMLKEARRAFVVVAVLIGLVGAAATSYGSLRPELQVVKLRADAIVTASPYDARHAIWSEARREIVAHPWTGVGPGNFQVASRRGSGVLATVAPLHAHNIWLTWAAECGLPAAGLVLAFCVSLAVAVRRVARDVRRRGDRRDAAVVAGLAAALVSVAGQGLVDDTLRNAANAFAVWGLVGVAFALDRASSRRMDVR